jgi:triphosphoribosyl-dephospho-CoA synthase
MLLAIIATLDDTCILYRSNQEVLALVQQLAQKANQQALPNPAFHALAAFCQSKNVSPGGSADLLAASFFLLSINSILPVNEGRTVYQ